MTHALPPFPWYDVVVILLLIGVNGLLAMAELAIVSSRKPRLKAMAKRGRGGAQTALDLAADPGRFLSTVQIGITGIAVLAGAFSGSALGGPVGEPRAARGLAPGPAEPAGFAIVIVLPTCGPRLIGEPVPKQVPLRSPEPIAVF